MTKQPGVLARLLGRSKHPVVSALAAAALNRPLLAQPAMAETLIGAYLSGAATSAEAVLQVEVMPLAAPAAEEKGRAVGVINISGGLVNRPMPGPSGSGPVSYAAIRDEFDTLLADDSVSAIVLRIESPGGMASGCFDLSDHIFASRGGKPIHALVDDYAYSGAYAIAAACDRVWVSRTGGVGSVGAVAFHYDWSGNNDKVGLKVTPIYAGARKVDFNPNFPLSDEALARRSEQIESLYGLFVDSVASYRGIDADQIRSTQADVYQGSEAVASGLATDLGTWDDLMAELGAPSSTESPRPVDPSSDTDDKPEVSRNSPPAVMELSPEQVRLLARGAMLDSVSAAKLPPLVKAALIESENCADILARIAHAEEVVDLCKTAGAEDRAADFVRHHAEITQVRSGLLAAKAAEDEKITLQTALPAIGAAKSSAANGLDPTAIYQKRGK